jgi:hypothetical protein
MICAVAIIATAIVSATLAVTLYAACVIAGKTDRRMEE